MARKATQPTQPVQSSGRGPMPLGAFAFMAVVCFAVIGQCTAPDTEDAREAAAQAAVSYMEYNTTPDKVDHERRLELARAAADKYVFVDTGIFGGGDVQIKSSYWGKLEYAGPVSNPDGQKIVMTFNQNGW